MNIVCGTCGSELKAAMDDCPVCDKEKEEKEGEFCTHCNNKPLNAHTNAQVLSCYGMYLTAHSPNKELIEKYRKLNETN